MNDQERCPTSCANHGKAVCPWHNYSAPSSVAEQPSREQAVEGLVEALIKIRGSLGASQKGYIKIIEKALAQYEASRGGKQ